MSVFGVVAVVQNASFFAQAAILAACACVIDSRKRHALTCDGATVSGATMAGVDHHALLATPRSDDRPSTDVGGLMERACHQARLLTEPALRVLLTSLVISLARINRGDVAESAGEELEDEETESQQDMGE